MLLITALVTKTQLADPPKKIARIGAAECLAYPVAACKQRAIVEDMRLA